MDTGISGCRRDDGLQQPRYALYLTVEKGLGLIDCTGVDPVLPSVGC